MKFKRILQKYILNNLGFHDPNARDCLKRIKRKTDAVGTNLSDTPGKRVYKTNNYDYIIMESNDDGALVIKHHFSPEKDIPTVYVDYLGKIKSIIRSYKKGLTKNNENCVSKETIITKYIHKINEPSVKEQAPSKNHPYRIEIYKDKDGCVLEESRFISSNKPLKSPDLGKCRKNYDGPILPPLNI